jgi:ribosome biogenesis GTPase
MTDGSLASYGWDEGWAARLAELPDDLVPGRVVRHDGSGLLVSSADGVVAVPLGPRLDPEPVVGDWVALDRDHPVAVLARRSLLRRRAAIGEGQQSLAANIDVVLLVCGVDRPVKAGRIQRSATLARDAGAEPVVVLTKAALTDDPEALIRTVTEAQPGIDVLVVSVKEGRGLDELRARVEGRTVTLLGESGAGKSSIVNALLGREAASTGRVRTGDAKGRHTTTTRELHVLPGGGVLVDTPGIRAVGLLDDVEAVTETFADVDEVADGCRFTDCRHEGEPGCQVAEALAEGRLTEARLAGWRGLRDEAEAAAFRASPQEQKRREKGSTRHSRDTSRRKRR